MTYTEILELIRAGYSKAEIDAMIAGQDPAPAAPAAPATPDKQPEQTPVSTDPEPKPDKPDPVPSPDPAPAAQPTETEKLIRALGLKLDTLTTAIHAANVGGMENPNNPLTPEQVVARIINPHLNDK